MPFIEDKAQRRQSMGLCHDDRCSGCRPQGSQDHSAQYNRVCAEYMLRCIAARVQEVLEYNRRGSPSVNQPGHNIRYSPEQELLVRRFVDDPGAFLDAERANGRTVEEAFDKIVQILWSNFEAHYGDKTPGSKYVSYNGKREISERFQRRVHISSIERNSKIAARCIEAAGPADVHITQLVEKLARIIRSGEDDDIEDINRHMEALLTRERTFEDRLKVARVW